MDTAGRAGHLLLLLFPTHNLTTLNRDRHLTPGKRKEWVGFLKLMSSYPSQAAPGAISTQQRRIIFFYLGRSLIHCSAQHETANSEMSPW